MTDSSIEKITLPELLAYIGTEPPREMEWFRRVADDELLTGYLLSPHDIAVLIRAAYAAGARSDSDETRNP